MLSRLQLATITLLWSSLMEQCSPGVITATGSSVSERFRPEECKFKDLRPGQVCPSPVSPPTSLEEMPACPSVTGEYATHQL